MSGLADLRRQYEQANFPPDRRLDLHGEAPAVARERALHWIQSRAHERPGEELLLIVERAVRPGRPPSAVAEAVRKLLLELEGKLIDWWQPFAPGSLALRISATPSMLSVARPAALEGDGRTEATAGAARPPPADDIPPELMDTATRAAELRIEREGLSPGVLQVVLREIWIEAQALAMERRITFAAAMDRVVAIELTRTNEARTDG